MNALLFIVFQAYLRQSLNMGICDISEWFSLLVNEIKMTWFFEHLRNPDQFRLVKAQITLWRHCGKLAKILVKPAPWIKTNLSLSWYLPGQG